MNGMEGGIGKMTVSASLMIPFALLLARRGGDFTFGHLCIRDFLKIIRSLRTCNASSLFGMRLALARSQVFFEKSSATPQCSEQASAVICFPNRKL